MTRIANKAGAGEAYSGNFRSGGADGVVLIHALARSRRSMWPMSARVAGLVDGFLRDGSFDRVQESKR